MKGEQEISEKKDALISYLKAHNEELHNEALENESLKSQLVDLKHKYQELLLEQERSESEARAKEESLVEIQRNLTIDMRKLENAILAVEVEQKKAVDKIYLYKDSLALKNERIAKLTNEMKELEKEKESLEESKLKTDLDNLQKTKETLEKEKEGLLVLNERIRELQKTAEESLFNTDQEAASMAGKISKMKDELEYLAADNERKRNELDLAREGRKLNLEEIGNLSNKNQDLEREVNELRAKAKDAEGNLENLRKTMEETISLASIKGKEVEELRREANKGNLRRLQEENKELKFLLDKYRKDAEVERRLREEEAWSKAEIAREKQRIEQEALLKELEASSAERELAQIQGTRERFLDEKLQATYELEAVKEHVDLLESQNVTLSRELDRFVDTNERVRSELNRKGRVDALKSANLSALERSAEKIRTSPYRTPGRGNYN